jgi:hypothetical protein
MHIRQPGHQKFTPSINPACIWRNASRLKGRNALDSALRDDHRLAFNNTGTVHRHDSDIDNGGRFLGLDGRGDQQKNRDQFHHESSTIWSKLRCRRVHLSPA